MKKYYLYWIKAKHHQDPYSEGYIGCSCQPKTRFRSHTTDNTNAGSKQVKKYVEMNGIDSVSLEILAEFTSEEQAKKAEQSFRPHHSIGWNKSKGGLKNPDCTGVKHSKDTNLKRTKAMLATREGRRKLNPEKYENFWKGKTGRYTSEQRALIGSYHKGKVISEEHKKAIKLKNSGANNVSSKRTAICDTETDVVTIGNSLAELAKYLGINHSALKSAKREYLLTGHIRLMRSRYMLVPEQGED